MNGLENVLSALENGTDEVIVDDALLDDARRPLQRMLDFSSQMVK